MSNKPAEELQAEALDLSAEERARLAYRLLESLDKAVAPDVASDAVTGEHTRDASPPEPKPRANPLPQYRVRLDDDGDVAIPVRFTVRADPRPEKPADGTVSADALRAGVIAAGPAEVFPTPKPKPAPVTASTLDSDSAFGVPDAQAVAALLHRLSPVGQPPVQQEARVAPVAAAKMMDLAPDPFAPKPPVRIQNAERDAFADWEKGVEADDSQTDSQGALVGLGTTLPVRRRTGVVVTTVVGSVGAMAALGIVALQNRNPAPDDFTRPVAAMTPAITPVEPASSTPVQETSSAPAAAVATSASQRSSTPTREPEAPPPAGRDEGEAPAVPRPNNSIPAIPTLGALAVTDANVAPARIGAPSAVIPNTRGSSAAIQPLQVPQVKNGDRVQQALEREYPIGLRSVGVSGSVQLSFYVNDQGAVERFQIEESSGVAALDQAALRVAPEFEFTPAQRGNERVAGWFSRTITFGSRVNVAANTVAQPTAGATADANQPAATRFDLAPQVRNTPRIQQELERAYPVNLRDAGVGGKAEVWFYIDEQGVVERTLLKKTSGNTALDQAALRVARVFQFNPGQVDGQRTAGWYSVTIAFDGKTGARA